MKPFKITEHSIRKTQSYFNPFSTNVSVPYPLKIGFLMFSGGIEVEHWSKMG